MPIHSIKGMIRLAVLSFIFLFLVITAISLFFPSRIRISRAINIKTSIAKVWDQVDDLRNWEQWNPFFSNLASKKVEYIDTAGGKWNALKVETTTVKWKIRENNERIAEMQNEHRKPVMSGWRCMNNQVQTDSLTVQWYMDFKLGWLPWEKFGSLFYEKKYGSQMEIGLLNLKNKLEK